MNAKKGSDYSRLLPYATALIVFTLIIVVYFYPYVEGKKLKSGDMVHFKAMSKEIVDYRNKTGQEALWTNNMFGGMPAYQISVKYGKNLMTYVHEIFRLGFGLPIGMVIMYFLGFYFLLLVLRINPWLSIAGAIAFAFSSYFFVILVAGHTSKAYAIGYMAPVLAGIILTYRGKYLLGGILTSFFLALEIVSGHPQITYYLMIMVLLYGVAELIRYIREKQVKEFARASVVLLMAGLLAVLTHTAYLWNTYEYSKLSIREATELTTEKANRTSGLDKDYAVDWSYGIDETMTLLIPGFYGGSSSGSLSTNSATYKALIANRVSQKDAESFMKGLPLYWGEQKFTSGPVYVGAIILFLFIFSLFYLKGPLKWWGITVTVLSILLSWGKHFMPLTNFFLDYVPLYNKFRAVSMTLVIAEFSIPLLAILAMDQLIRDAIKTDAFKFIKISFYITGGISLLIAIFAGTMFSYTGPQDATMGLPDWFLQALREDRMTMLRTDALRSLAFIMLTFVMLWLYIKGKLKLNYMLIILPVLILVDMWPVDKRFLNNDNFERKTQVENPYQASKADLAILKDPDPYYRVFDLNDAFDQAARTSYFHKNIGGYHGAKLRRYQELIDGPLAAERNLIAKSIIERTISTDEAIKQANAFNMLNTKYFIVNQNMDPIRNQFALGNVWFVKGYRLADNADQELAAIDEIKPDSIAVLDKRFESALSGFTGSMAPGGKISLVSYAPNKLVYQSSSGKDEMAVFSEIYYDKGWNAYIDGRKAPYFRADFVLRAMIIPAGDHKIEFRFEPRSYYTGQMISLVSSLILILLMLGYLVKSFMDSRKRA